MNTEEAKVLAQDMTYDQAIYNVFRGKSIPYRKATMIKIHEMAEKIKQLENSGWIPVEDNLPKEDEMVMVTMERDGHRTTTKAIYYSGSLFWNNYVTAWMPYIEPYNPESEE